MGCIGVGGLEYLQHALGSAAACMHFGISVLSEMEMGHSLALKKILLA